MQPRKIILLGSTGSIGTQAIDVVDAAPTCLRSWR
ncbi:1-deoxy-D-xylulose 5-phosphate reductoisomerase [Arthrobacter sp. Hiyo8]|nr:1-deoxy-D-xylulose 5-phosphate reductoisomerase [Arthrobacter sp. Hiyo8]